MPRLRLTEWLDAESFPECRISRQERHPRPFRRQVYENVSRVSFTQTIVVRDIYVFLDVV